MDDPVDSAEATRAAGSVAEIAGVGMDLWLNKGNPDEVRAEPLRVRDRRLAGRGKDDI
jgi:hypothetical protein